MAGFLKGGKFKPTTATESKEEKVAEPVKSTSPFGKKKLGGLSKPAVHHPPQTTKEESAEPKELDLDQQQEELHAEEPKSPAAKPSLGKKKLGGGLKKKETTTEEVKEEVKEEVVEVKVAEETPVETKKEVEEEKPKKTTKKSTAKKTTKKAEPSEITVPEVDESKRVSIEEMDAVMRPIVAPTTAAWEQEKKDVLAALDSIEVEQDMTMAQVKNALAELDDLKFEILPKQHDAETLYDGTKQNYDTVKAIAISKGSATNAEGRKAEGILACQNYVTPGGEVVDLHQYMLLIEERNKFYQKVVEGITFKKYSLVNYNNALKAEAKDS